MERLRHRKDFLAAARGVRAPAAAFVLQMRRRGDEGPARVGLTVSRKVGTAVERNRARRRLREMVRHADHLSMTPGCDYVLVARREALTHPFGRLIADFRNALRRAGTAAGGGKKGASGAQRDSGLAVSRTTEWPTRKT